jgi:GH24 family phage-related lysozyme (muramidase)
MNKDKIWYHGTPDVRNLENEGGFTKKYIDISFVDDIKAWKEKQEILKSTREKGNEDVYFKTLDTVGELKKYTKIRKPIFLTDVYSVAKTYADPHRAFNYQEAVEKVLKVKVKEGKGVTIIAPNSRFRFIDIEKVKNGFINSGVNKNELEEIIEKINYAEGVDSGIRTDSIAAIGEWLGFDYIDVVGVLDSYRGGNTKSTVRMVFNPNDITIVKDDVLREFEEYIHLNLNNLNESDEPSPTFEWDIAKEKIEKSQKNIKNTSEAKEYLKNFIQKVKDLPIKFKSKLLKIAVGFILVFLSYNHIMEIINENSPELKSIFEKKDFENFNSPTKSSLELKRFLKHEEGSITQKGEPVLSAYKLGDKMITIGWGHAEIISKSQYKIGDKITREKAEELLNQDIKDSEIYLNKILKNWKNKGIQYNINQEMYDVMISLIFNMGIGNFRTSEFIQLIKKGHYDLAKEKILTTNITHPGHKPRREREYEMFGDNENLNKNFIEIDESFVVAKKNKIIDDFQNIIKGLKQQNSETKTAFKKITQYSKGEIKLNSEDKKEIGNTLKNLLKTSGYLGLLALPGGSIFALLLKVFKLNKYILPPAFINENKQKNKNNNKIITEDYKKRLKKLAGIK